MNAKQELLSRAAGEYQAFHATIAGLNEAQMTEVWLGTWSVKDIVAHMSGWHREMAPALVRLSRGEKPLPEGASYEDVDGWNARFVDAARGHTVADVLLAFDATHQAFMRAADGVPEARWEAGKTTTRIVDLNSAHHYHEHGAQVRTWRAERGI